MFLLARTYYWGLEECCLAVAIFSAGIVSETGVTYTLVHIQERSVDGSSARGEALGYRKLFRISRKYSFAGLIHALRSSSL